MDVNDLRIAVTLFSLALFIALVAYTWSRKRRGEYEDAARLPFAADDFVNNADSVGDRP